MMQWLLNSVPWGVWIIPLGALVFLAWYLLGSKGAAGATVGAMIALISARSRQKGYDAARRENEDHADDLINEGVKARRDADRRNADPSELRKTDGYRRD